MVGIAVILGLVASVLLVALAAVHTRRLVICVSVVLSVVVAAQYVVLGEFAAAGVSLVGLVFALAAVFIPRRKSVTVPVVALMVVCLSVVSLLTGGIPVHPLGWVSVGGGGSDGVFAVCGECGVGEGVSGRWWCGVGCVYGVGGCVGASPG